VRVAWIALLLARYEGVGDPGVIVQMALVHDIAETRTSDFSYVQWLYPGTALHPDLACYPLGTTLAGSVPQLAAMMTSETTTHIPMEEQSLAFFYWPRFICCNYCSASNESAAKLLVPEQSFLPALSRVP
jgi:hypothetical protein